MKKKLCILAAGTGSRLGTISENLGKALLPIGNSTAISKIINKFSKDFEIIIAVGYKSELLKSYCSAVHFDRKISFVEIDNFDKPGSGPGYSLLKCKELLGNERFYLSTVDCLIDEEIPNLDCDWIGTSKTNNPKLYSTAEIDDEQNILKFINKNKNGFSEAFIGIAYIYTPDVFWSTIEKYSSKEKEIEFVAGWYQPNLYKKFISINFTWNDTGNIEGYNKTLSKYGKPNLGMSKSITENTFFENNKIAKICIDKEKNNKRFERSKELKKIIPKITHKSDYIVSYDWVDGQEMYYQNNPIYIDKLLDWLQENLWKTKDQPNFNEKCFDFYSNKTYIRYEKINFIKDNSCLINGLDCLPVNEILSNINFNKLSEGMPVKFHGDLQFQNIIYNKGSFKLIDWREEFTENLYTGDIYYDLSKLYACLLLDYSSINEFSNSIHSIENNYFFEIKIKESLKIAKEKFEFWIFLNKYDLDKIKILAGIIWLNMSPLHTYPVNVFLFLKAKYYLNSLRFNNSYVEKK